MIDTDDGFHAAVRRYLAAVDDLAAAARNLKPFACGEELYYERFGRSEETECFFAEAGPLEKISYLAFDDLLTPEACARLHKAAEQDHWFKKLTGYDAKLRAVQKALDKIPPDCPRSEWRDVGMALKDEYGENGFFYWNMWSKPGDKYPGEEELRYQWESWRGSGVTLGTLFYLAEVYSA